jgi:NADH-quinone oxidoreductase subunit N
MIQAILPEILLLVLMGVIVLVDLVQPGEKKSGLGWVTAFGLGLILVIMLIAGRPGERPVQLWGGMVSFDWLSFSFKCVFLFGAAITAIFAVDYPKLGRRGEFYLLLLVSTMGMNMMVSASDLIMLYLAIETTSIPLYVLAGFMVQDDKSTEAGFKYLLFGAMASSVMLYGFSLLYGFAGTTSLGNIAGSLQSGQVPVLALSGSLILVLVGLSFKISVVPFHFWAPDVYEGAPTPVAGFLSTASKAAGFAVLLRVLMEIFPQISGQWGAIMAAFAVATMTLGNLLALSQKNIKRMLAYSSIAHAGYALLGVVAISAMGTASTVMYLIAYLVTNLAAFGVVAVYSKTVGSDEISAYAGMSRRSPGLALVLLVALLSLAGMPPLAGFVAKFLVFAAAVEANLIGLAVIGVLNSIIGLYYYLIVLKVVYLERSPDDDKPLAVASSDRFALVVLSFMIILIGVMFAPWFTWATAAAKAMF